MRSRALVLVGCGVLVGGCGLLEPSTDGVLPGLGSYVPDAPVEEAPGEPPEVRVVPASPVAGESLRCVVETEGEVSDITWFRDGLEVRVVGDVVPGDQVDGYQQWTCAASLEAGGTDEASVEVDETCTSLHVGTPLRQTYTYELDLVHEALTVEAWVHLDVAAPIPAGTGAWHTVIARQDTVQEGPDATDYLLRLDGTEVVEFVTGGGDDCAVQRADVALLHGWHHVAATWDPELDLKRIWVDGVRVGQCDTGSRTHMAYGDVTVGGRLRGGSAIVDPFPGWIDEVHVASTVRYRQPFTPARYPEADEHTRWLLHFDDLVGLGRAEGPAVVRDSSRHRLHLTLDADQVLSAERSTCDADPVDAVGAGPVGAR